jgi:thiamine biosynthesis lipoprotein
MLSITVLHPSAGWADALATGLFVMGIDKAIEYCERNPDVRMLAILPSNRDGQCEVVTSNLSFEAMGSSS